MAPRILRVDDISSSTRQDGLIGYETCLEVSLAEVDEDNEDGWIDALHIAIRQAKRHAKGAKKEICAGALNGRNSSPRFGA